MSQTKEQHKIYMRKWNKENALSLYQTRKFISVSRKQFILDAKNKPCHDCNKSFNSWQMQFDHREPQEKRFNVGGSYTRSFKNLAIEISKCDVVCANCHADRTYKQGRKAHKGESQ
jgi:hypothetical protein